MGKLVIFKEESWLPQTSKDDANNQKSDKARSGLEVEWINKILNGVTRMVITPVVNVQNIQQLYEEIIEELEVSEPVRHFLEMLELEQVALEEFPLQFTNIKYQLCQVNFKEAKLHGS